MGGSAKATVTTCSCRRFFLFFFFLSAPLFPSPPALCRYSLPLCLLLFVKQQSSSSCCFVSATAASDLLRVFFPRGTYIIIVCVLFSTTYVWCSSGNCSLSFPFLSDLLGQLSSEHLSFFWLCFIFLFFSSFFLFFPFFLWSRLFCCCALVPGTLTLHLLYLNEMRLFGLLCFTVVCDHIFCISLSIG